MTGLTQTGLTITEDTVNHRKEPWSELRLLGGDFRLSPLGSECKRHGEWEAIAFGKQPS